MTTGGQVRRAALLYACVVLVAGLSAATTGVAAASAAEDLPERAAGQAVVFILDASGSMRADDGSGRSRMEAAREAMTALATDLPADLEVGLRIFGHRVPASDREASCLDSELVVPVTPHDRDRLIEAVEAAQPNGYTPIGLSLQAAADDLDGRRGTIVLVSDGLDTCAPPDPCEVAHAIIEQGVEVRFETIGFQVDEEARQQLRCIADAGQGNFHDATDAGELADALRSYLIRGEPVTGGATAAEALLLEPGRYRDTITLGQARWYAVEPPPGQSARTQVTLVGDREGTRSETARLRLQLRRGDLLGDLLCDAGELTGIGGDVAQVTVRGPTIDPDRAQCARPSRYLLPLELIDPRANPEGPDPLEGLELDIEIIVAFDGEPLEEVVEEAVRTRPRGPLPPAEPPASPSGPTLPAQAGTAVVLAVLGYTAGVVGARKAGP